MALVIDNTTCSHSFLNSFCQSCGAVSYQKSVAIKHPKYIYKADLNPVSLLYSMIASNQTLSSFSQLSKDYIETRKDLLTILRLVNSRLDFNSQTFFLAMCYLDELFTKRLPSKTLRDHLLLALSCLLIASKFTENDPNVPELQKYLSAIADATRYRFTYTIYDLQTGELLVLKSLNYKLNYYSIYHFITFFFAHGVLFSKSGRLCPVDEMSEAIGANDRAINPTSNKLLLEKVYILSRELLDYMIEDETFVVIGKDNAIASVEILKKAIESVVHVDNKDEDVFSLIYQLSKYISSNPRSEQIKQMVAKVHELRVLKKRDASMKLVVEPIQEDIIMSDNLKRDTYKSRFHLNLNDIKASFSNNYDRPMADINNNRDYSSNLTVRKRACSLSKEPMRGTEELPAKSKAVFNLNGHSNYSTSFVNNNQDVLINTHFNPVYNNYTKRPPIKSIRIKKEIMPSNTNSLSTTATTATHMVNSQSNNFIPPLSQLYQQDEDILDKTKKLFENANKAANDSKEHYNSAFSATNSGLQLNISSKQPELESEESKPTTYNTIIINNNININTFIQKKSTYDELKKWRMEKEDKSSNSNHLNYLFEKPEAARYQKETNLIHRPNYFGTYFDYGSDLLTSKISTRLGRKKYDKLFRMGDDMLPF